MGKGVTIGVILIVVILAVIVFFLMFGGSSISIGGVDADPLSSSVRAQLSEEADFASCEGSFGFLKGDDFCIQLIGEIKADSGACSVLEGDKQEYCMNGVAIADDDQSHCSGQEEDDVQAACYHGFAVRNKDESLCARIDQDDEQNACYLKMAQVKDEPEICESISEDSESSGYVELTGISKDYCYLTFLDDFESGFDEGFCDNIDNSLFKNACLVRAARLNHDAALCHEIEEATELAYLSQEDGCFYNVATEYEDYALCDEIQREATRAGCHGVVAAKQGEPEHCMELSSEQQYICYTFIALVEQEVSYCENIPAEDRESCQRYAEADEVLITGALLKNGEIDESICKDLPESSEENEIIDLYSRDGCYLSTAWLEQDRKICSSIDDEVLKNDCTSFVSALNSDDLIYCFRVSEQDTKSSCLFATTVSFQGSDLSSTSTISYGVYAAMVASGINAYTGQGTSLPGYGPYEIEDDPLASLTEVPESIQELSFVK